jgi:hypothetical protein
MASNEFYTISWLWRRQWFIFDSLILSLGDTASQILRMLPKLEYFGRDDSPMSFKELSAASKNLGSLTCLKGLDFDTSVADLSLLRFERLEKVDIECNNASEFQFIANVLENSIPQGRQYLKSLRLVDSDISIAGTVDYAQLQSKSSRLDFSLIIKTSPGLKYLQLAFNFLSETVNLDACLEDFFGLDQITTLYLICFQISLEKIKFALRKQGGRKRWEEVALARLDQEMNDSDILEICSSLPSLKEWSVICPKSTITIDGVRKWKRICPNLETVKFAGRGGLSKEVKEVLRGLGVTVK